ncbi:MAG: hypothetical protein ACREK4_24130 [Candidatus Rokuibacteriota bacterium]
MIARGKLDFWLTLALFAGCVFALGAFVGSALGAPAASSCNRGYPAPPIIGHRPITGEPIYGTPIALGYVRCILAEQSRTPLVRPTIVGPCTLTAPCPVGRRAA